MISIEKERMIRSMLALKGTSKVCISREIGVSVDTVRKISKLPALRERKAIRASTGFSEIPKVPRVKCSGCGSLVNVWPCLVCHPSGGMPDTARTIQKPRVMGPTKTLEENMPEMIRVSQDILDISELRIQCFDNPLFRALVSRAGKVLRKLNVKKGDLIDVKLS